MLEIILSLSMLQASKISDIDWITEYSIIDTYKFYEGNRHMCDEIKEKFNKNAIIYGNMRMYFIRNLEEIINFCEERKINIQSIDAFKITGKGIQPSMANSIDFNQNGNSWVNAREFVSNIVETIYIYEIWYEGYG